MPRARNVKPGLFLNEDLVECSIPARYLFVGLWTQADCFGRLENRPKKIKMALLPCDNVDISALLQELADRGFIAFYGEGKGDTDATQPYLWITGFERHQSPHHRELAAGSSLPAPEECQPGASPRPALGKPEASPGQAALIPDSLNLIPDSLNLKPETGDPPGGAASVNGKKIDFAPILEAWRTKAVPRGFPDYTRITDRRRRALQARAADPEWLALLPEALDAMIATPFYSGENDRNWKADLDYLLKPDSVHRLVEHARAGTGKPRRELTRAERAYLEGAKP